MKISIPTKEDHFNVNCCDFCGTESYLIVPKADAKWSKNNLHFRSIIVDKEGNVLSSGFKKFLNYGEKTDCYPDPEKYNDWSIEDKKDGSLLIVDVHNGAFSMRTRGTSSYKSQENHKDFDLLPLRYPKTVDFLSKNNNFSLLFEIESPNNVIVIRPNDIEFTFLNAIDKNTLTMVDSIKLLEIWREIGCPPSPEKYHFNDSRDLRSISEYIKRWKGKEGVVLTYNKGQNKLKFKSDWYVFISRIKSQLSSTASLIEFYLDYSVSSSLDFFKKLEKEYDYEIAAQLRNEIEKISRAGEECKGKLFEINSFVNKLKGKERKDQASKIIEKYGKDNLSSLAFSILDDKKIENKNKFILIKKYIENEPRIKYFLSH